MGDPRFNRYIQSNGRTRSYANDHHSSGSTHPDGYRCLPEMGIQPRLGLLSEWRTWLGRARFADTGSAGQSLRAKYSDLDHGACACIHRIGAGHSVWGFYASLCNLGSNSPGC